MNCLATGFSFEIGRFLAGLAITGGIIAVSAVALIVMVFLARRR